MPAAFGLAPVPDVGEALLRPPPGRPLQLAREHRAARRDVHRGVSRPRDPLVHLPDALPVEPGGRGAGAGQPVHHHVVQQVVPAEHGVQGAVMVGPGPELLHDPGGQERGRVHQAVPDRLRPGGVLSGVPGVPLGGVFQRRHGRPFGVGQIVQGRRVGPGQRRYQVDAGHVRRVLLPEQGADAGAPVAAGRAVPRVAQPRHQLGPRPGDPLHAPAGTVRLAAEPVAGQRRAHHVKRVTAVIGI